MLTLSKCFSLLIAIQLVNSTAFAMSDCEWAWSKVGNGKSEIESNILPFGSEARLVAIPFRHSLRPEVAVGDLAIIRVDVSGIQDKGLVVDTRRPEYLFTPGFSDSTVMKILSARPRSYGDGGLEYIYLAQALAPGKTEFSTSRRYRVLVGQKEMGQAEIKFLQIIIGYRDRLLQEGSQMPAFPNYLESVMPNVSPITKRIFQEWGEKEEGKTWEERLVLAEANIDSWRQSLAPPIYGEKKISGNAQPLEITPLRRPEAVGRQIHQLRFDRLPEELVVSQGDMIVVEAIRPQEVVGGDYSHRYEIPQIKGNGLLELYYEVMESARLANDHGINRSKTYFYVDSDAPASIEIADPKIFHPYLPGQEPRWVKKINIRTNPF